MSLRLPVAPRLLRGPRLPLAAEDGFTLIEVLMATVILVVGLVGLLGLLDDSVKAGAATRAREGATNLAREIVEDARTIPYAQVIPESIESQLQAMNDLADESTASGWQIDRRGFSYTVTVKECAIDDPKDGLAKTHGSTFCEGQSTGGEEDTEPEDLKRITVEVTWTLQNRTSTVKQVSTLTAAGQAIGLIVTKLELTTPAPGTEGVEGKATEPVITGKEVKSLTFTVTFPEGTRAISWSLEGAKQEELAPSSKATSLTFTWKINEPAQKIYVSDGTYQISAQAVDSTGVIGPPVSIPVRLIRSVPVAPTELLAGFNIVYKGSVATEVVELEWKANAERDVIGYRVFGPKGELVCPESLEAFDTETSCLDFGVPEGKPSERAYKVSAIYRNASNEVVEGPAATVTAKQSESVAPNVPTNLIATKRADGSVTLKWTAPSGGVTPSFYRIYRGSREYTSRYGETTATEFTDSEASSTHEYWVTAVGAHLTESPFLGPVSS